MKIQTIALVNVRQEAKKADNVVRVAQKGEIFEVVKETKKWVETREGFIMKEFTQEVNEDE